MSNVILVIDVQNEYFTGKMPITYPEGCFDNILKVVDHANKNNLKIILIQHTVPMPDAPVFAKGSHDWEIKSELLERSHNLIVEKFLPGSFTGTILEEKLKEWDIKKVTICGYMTQMCCDTTARQALHLGYEVEFISDATGTLDLTNYAGTISAKDLHHAILTVQASRFSRVLSTDEWIRENR